MSHPERHPATRAGGSRRFAKLAAVGRRSGRSIVGLLALVALAAAAAPGAAWALPEGRVYEMVSPVYKGGFGVVRIEAVSPNGESVAFYSPGAFAGAPSGLTGSAFVDYVAHRTPSGWSTTSVLSPATLTPEVTGQDFSSTFETALVVGKPGANLEATTQAGTQEEILSHPVASADTSANWQISGYVIETLEKSPIVLDETAASADLCHTLIDNDSGGQNPGQQLLPEAAEASGEGLKEQIYEFDLGCGGQPSTLRVQALNNAHELLNPSCALDEGLYSQFNLLPAGGLESFFTMALAGCGSGQLFVRLDGRRTVEVSRPLGSPCSEVPCAGAGKRASANFIGASNDGSRVFFETAAYPGEGAGNELYMATIGCPAGSGEACEPAEVPATGVTSLVQVSHDSNTGEAAEVQGVVRVAPDGSRVYFVARGALTETANVEGHAPVKGADNLYVYDTSTGVAFVADLCSGYELSGSAPDPQCPNEQQSDTNLWHRGEAQTAGGDGRYLVFGTYAQLVAGDTDAASDIYRYDALSGRLERVSIGEHGYDANGNNSAFDAKIQEGSWGGVVRAHEEMGTRAISEDGSRIVFTTAEPLSPDAGRSTNVYEWHSQPGSEDGGEATLISGPGDEEPVEDAVISPGGDDIFFITSQGLVPQDTDGAPDVYDARLDGGFPAAPAETLPCSSDACQGELTNPAPLLVAGSAAQAPGENLAPPVVVTAKSKAKSKAKPKPKAKAKKKRKPKKKRDKAKKASMRGAR